MNIAAVVAVVFTKHALRVSIPSELSSKAGLSFVHYLSLIGVRSISASVVKGSECFKRRCQGE